MRRLGHADGDLALPRQHKPRRIEFQRILEFNGWRVKLYTIVEDGLTILDDSHLAKARSIAEYVLPLPAVGADRHGVGFVTIHCASLFNQIIVDWWERDNELRHRVFKAAANTPLEYSDITHTGEAFCVRELRVIGFERDAWIEGALRNPSAEAIDDYLDSRLTEFS